MKLRKKNDKSRAFTEKRLPAMLLVFMTLFINACALGEASDTPSLKNGVVTPLYISTPAEALVVQAKKNFQPNKIIGQDDRIKIEDIEAFPYGAVAFMDVICACGCGWECTGTVAGKPNIILTAAHALVCADHGEKVESIIFYFGYQNHRQYRLRYDGNWKAWVGNDYADCEYSFQEDWGLVLLDEPLGEQVGCLEILWPEENSAIPAQTASIVGYSDGILFADKGDLCFMEPEYYQYKMDQDSGASGGPILDENNRIIGVVIGHQTDDDGVQSNVGLMLTKALRDAYAGIIDSLF